MLLTYFVDSLSNPLFIVTICVPKRSEKIICVDYQTFMFFVPKVNSVENEESMWKHSPKSKVASKVRLLLPICVPLKQLFSKFFSIKVLLLKIKLVPLHRVLF